MDTLRYYVSLSENPGPFVKDDGPEMGVIVATVEDGGEPPEPNYFSIACSQFNLGDPRIIAVLPFLGDFDLAWRSVKIGKFQFWTDSEPNSFCSGGS